MTTLVLRVGRKVKRLARRAVRMAFPEPQAPVPTVAPSVASDTRELRAAVQEIKTELNAQMSFLAHDLGARIEQKLEPLAARQTQIEDMIKHLQSDLGGRLNTLDTAVFETFNKAAHLDTGLNSRLNQIEYVLMPGLLEQLHETAAMQTEFHSARQDTATATPRLPDPLPNGGLAEAMDRARADFPGVFHHWLTRLDEMKAAFDTTKTGNAANAADVYSRLFRVFVNAHARGTVLDVGSGPFGTPFYLLDYPAHLVAGIEPLGQRGPSEITIVEGISEYLPWPAQSFSTVISATSLDHCVSLQKSLNEIDRVLADDGRILLWIGSNPGFPPYDPDATDFEPADKFHLFHFDIEWFEPMLAAKYEFESRIKLDRAGYSHVFYCLVRRKLNG